MKYRFTLWGMAGFVVVFATLWVVHQSDMPAHPNNRHVQHEEPTLLSWPPQALDEADPASSDKSGDSPAGRAGDGTASILAEVPAGVFRQELLSLSEASRQRALQKLTHNRQLLMDAESIRVDANGMIYYVCTFAGDPQGNPESGAETVSIEQVGGGETLVPVSAPPALHSRSNAPYTLFLDFNGHVIEGTRWNETRAVSSWECRPYDKDGDETTFSTSELATITQVWERVAEDFAPFNVDVTTEEPAVWTRYTGHALITPTIDANGVACPHDGYGGIAYVDVFGDFRYSYDYSGSCYSPVFCVDYDAADAAEAISHELGHNLSLNHDGTGSSGYYSGHENGSISWAPIMGTGYNDDVTQWSDGQYYDANNTQDDLDIISDHLEYRADDHGNDKGTADPLTASVTGYLLADGVVESTGDTDVFSFSVDAGMVEVTVSPYRAASDTWGGNLDILLELYDSSDTLIASSNPELETRASISTPLVAGTYYVHIKPTSVGDPMANPPTGYALYGSLGQFSVKMLPPGGLAVSSAETGFEGGSLGLWRQSSEDDMDWTSREGETLSSSTGPFGASNGSRYLYTEASGNNNKTATLESPRFDLSDHAVTRLAFDFHMYGSDMGTLAVDVYSGTWTSNYWVRAGQQQTSGAEAWQTAVVDLSAFSGEKDVVLHLRGTTGDGYRSDMAIDNIRVGLDLDADGMPDAWEIQYFGSLTNGVPTADNDNDGFCNLDESISGHDPTNPDSFFRVDTMDVPGPAEVPFVISWDSQTGRVYGVQWTSDLTNGFVNISGDLPYPTGSYTDTVERTGNQQFYRIEVRKSP